MARLSGGTYASELNEFKLICRRIHTMCRRMSTAINATGMRNEVYEDPVTLSHKLNDEVEAIDIEAYKRSHSLYIRLFKLVKIIDNGLQDYEIISKLNKNLLWLIKGLVGGPESLEIFLRDITETLGLVRYTRSDDKKHKLPAKRVQKLCHILDRAKEKEGLTEARIKKAVGGLLRSGVKDLDELVSGAFGAATDDCPKEPTTGYVLRELKAKGCSLRYDYSALFQDNNDSSDVLHELFNRWEVQSDAVPISYIIPHFAILDYADVAEEQSVGWHFQNVAFKSFDNKIYRIGGTRWISGWEWPYYVPVAGATINDDQLNWRRFFPPCSYKRVICHEVCNLEFLWKLADGSSEDHKRKVSVLEQYMRDLQRKGVGHILNPRRFASKLSKLSTIGPPKESRLLNTFAGGIRRAIVAKGSLLTSLISGSFANWVVANVSQVNLNMIGAGDLMIWNSLKDESGKVWRFNLQVRRSKGSYFEGERCDIEVAFNIPGMINRERVFSIQHLAAKFNSLPARHKKQMYKLGVFFIGKLMRANSILVSPLGASKINPKIGARIFKLSRVKEIDPFPQPCGVKQKEKDWGTEDSDTMPNLALLGST